MQLIRGQQNFYRHVGPCCATIGTFDGLHLGHQAVLSRLKDKAQALGLPSAVILFEPQPQEFFLSHLAAPRLMRLRDKLACLKTLGIDVVVCLKFNKSLSSLSADQFIDTVLVKALKIRHLVVGDDFRFGSDRKGNYALLESVGKRFGFDVEPTSTLEMDGARISSTRVRQAVFEGNFAVAKQLLGRPFALVGRVHHGDKRGRVLGFPTLNIPLNVAMAVHGVYAVQVKGLAKEPLLGVANVGVRPTVNGTRRLLEVHLLDITVDAYGKNIEVEFLSRLRGEMKFPSLIALQQQIVEDVAQARAFFKEIQA